MITIFRKIRLQLLHERKPGKYFFYAVGEILLVVIGILIALWVNNWNENRKKENKGKELSSKLYKELLVTYQYSVDALKRFDRQIEYIDLILSQGDQLNIDSIMKKSEEYWAVQVFNFPTYILFFYEPFEPSDKLFKSAINDGSIQFVKDEKFVNSLEGVYISFRGLINLMLENEKFSNQKLETYISENYPYLFEDKARFKNGKWDAVTSKRIIEEMLNDGSIRFLLVQKCAKLKSKQIILRAELIPLIEKVIADYKNLGD